MFNLLDEAGGQKVSFFFEENRTNPSAACSPTPKSTLSRHLKGAGGNLTFSLTLAALNALQSSMPD